MQKRNADGRIIRKPKISWIGGVVIVECAGCENQTNDRCNIYISPSRKWRLGNCNMASHTIIRTKDTDKFKKRVGQQKKIKVMK